MEVTTKKLRRCDLVVAKGRIDVATVETLAQAFSAIEEAGRHKIVLNLKDVTYIASAGLSELINTQNSCRQLKRGELVLAEVPSRIKEAFDLAGLSSLFKMFDSETEAVGSF
jgi:anti-sigma B factor antagonist